MEAIFHEKVIIAVHCLFVQLTRTWVYYQRSLMLFLQQEGSLCAQHCLNALLQGNVTNFGMSFFSI